jgi:hypothetical protein
MFRIVVIAVFLLVAALPAVAQDAPPAGCTADDLLDLLHESSAAIDQPGADLNAVLLDAVAAIQQRRAVCFGYVFEGSGGTVIGPLELPAGDYVVDAEFGAMGTITAEGLDRACANEFLGFILVSLEMSGGTDSGIIRLGDDCRVLFDVSIQRPWTLTLTPVN